MRALWGISDPDLESAGGLGTETLVEKEDILAGILLELSLEA